MSYSGQKFTNTGATSAQNLNEFAEFNNRPPVVPKTRVNQFRQLTDSDWNNEHKTSSKLYPYYHGINQQFKETHMSDHQYSQLAKKATEEQRKVFVNSRRTQSLSRLHMQRLNNQARTYMSNQPIPKASLRNMVKIKSSDPDLVAEMAQLKPGPQNLWLNKGSFEEMNKLPRSQLENLINPQIVEKDRQMCEHIFVKLYEEDETAAYQERKARASWVDTRERFFAQHEKNINLEQRAKLQKTYSQLENPKNVSMDAIDSAPINNDDQNPISQNPVTQQTTGSFRVSSAQAKFATKKQVSQLKASKNLSRSLANFSNNSQSRKTLLNAKNPVAICQDFRGLLHTDFSQALTVVLNSNNNPRSQPSDNIKSSKEQQFINPSSANQPVKTNPSIDVRDAYYNAANIEVPARLYPLSAQQSEFKDQNQHTQLADFDQHLQEMSVPYCQLDQNIDPNVQNNTNLLQSRHQTEGLSKLAKAQHARPRSSQYISSAQGQINRPLTATKRPITSQTHANDVKTVKIANQSKSNFQRNLTSKTVVSHTSSQRVPTDAEIEEAQTYQDMMEFELRVDTKTQTKQKFSRMDLKEFKKFDKVVYERLRQK